MSFAALAQSNVGAWLGVGFNIYGPYDLLESSLPVQIFSPQKAPKVNVDPFGPLPEYLTWRPLTDKNFFQASGESRESFQSAFAARASVDLSVGAFSGHVEAAYGRGVAESSDFLFANYSFLGISGILVLSTDHYEQYLTDEFKEALAALPSTADPTHPTTLAKFSDFFQKFGTYFVSQVTLGATLEYYKAVSHSAKLTKESISAKASASYNALFVSGKVSAEMSSGEEWKAYQSSQETHLRVKGGGDRESSVLVNTDPNSPDSCSAATKAKFDNWLASTASNPNAMDYKLTGIWEVCGAKSKLVEDTFREYGKLMRPLLHVETKSDSPLTAGYRPGIFLNGRELPVQTSDVRPDYGGLQMIVVDRRHPDADGVKLSKLYNFGDPLHEDGYRRVYQNMLGDLKSFRGGDYFLIICTYNLYAALPPITDFMRAMQESGAGSQLSTWLKTTNQFSTHEATPANYIMVGIMGSGPGAAVEMFNTKKFVWNEPINASLDVYFYSLGPGKPYVLGQALQKLGAAV